MQSLCAFLTFALFGALAGMAQQPSSTSARLEVALRCTGVQTAPQSRAVKSNAYGFGNPTNPDLDQSTKHLDRVVLIELHGSSGRVYLPKAVLAEDSHPATGGWFSLTNVVATPDLITASLNLNPSGQSLRLDRRTGAGEILGYGRHPLRGVCRVDRKPQQF
jgi:hypothetical protein